MSNEQFEQHLRTALRQALNDDVAKMEPRLRRRLQAARVAALTRPDPLPRHSPWQTACALAICLLLLFSIVRPLDTATPVSELTQLEHALSADDLAISEDLEFYAWLAARGTSG